MKWEKRGGVSGRGLGRHGDVRVAAPRLRYRVFLLGLNRFRNLYKSRCVGILSASPMDEIMVEIRHAVGIDDGSGGGGGSGGVVEAGSGVDLQ